MKDQTRLENFRQSTVTFSFAIFVCILVLSLVSWERRYMQVGAHASEVDHLDLIFSGFTDPSFTSLHTAYGIEDSLFHKFFRQALKLYLSPHNVGAVIDYQLGLAKQGTNSCAFLKATSLINPESTVFNEAVHGLRRLNIFLFGMLLLLTLAIGRSLFPKNHELALLATIIIGLAPPFHFSIVQVSPDIFFSLFVTLASLPIILRQRSPGSFYGAAFGVSGLLASLNLIAFSHNPNLLPQAVCLVITPFTLLVLRSLNDFLRIPYFIILFLLGSFAVVYSLLSLHFTTTRFTTDRNSCLSELKHPSPDQKIIGFYLQTQDLNGDFADDITITHCLRKQQVSLMAKHQNNVQGFDIGEIEEKDCPKPPRTITIAEESQLFSPLPSDASFLLLDLDGDKINERVSWKSGERCLFVERNGPTTDSTTAIRVCPTVGIKLFRFNQHLLLFRLTKAGHDFLYAFNLRSGEITLLLEDLPLGMTVRSQSPEDLAPPSILTQAAVNFNPGFLQDNSLVGFRTLDVE